MKNKRNNQKLVQLGEWTTKQQDIDNISMPPNLMLGYDQTLDPIKIGNDFNIVQKVTDMRIAAEVHKQARRYIQSIIKPGLKYFDICEMIENRIVDIFGKNDLTRGIGFPVGFSANNVAAHDGPIINDTRVIDYNDVIKIDFGTHCNGNIIDSAFTLAFNPKFTPLLQSTKDATWTGIKMMGPDVLIYDVSTSIQEVIESYEFENNGVLQPIKAITNLGGHTIEPYNIHAGKLVLGGPDPEVKKLNWRMNIGECYAIETFATTGESNNIFNDLTYPVVHYIKNHNHDKVNFKLNATKKLYSYITKKYKTLPFTTRWLEKDFPNYKVPLKELENNNIVTGYPALSDKPGTYTSQLEHTIYMHEFGKEVLSYGNDY